ncbi:MAG TPA: GNAT family N-acetyltransferase, partial [Candidatus Sulfomarinibacteraceae bacterium]|nr:GNAT family N-acetyltransferase [Candidatus Sulfomarinibacteraceae bacterium]
ITIQPLTDDDREWTAQFIRVRWGASAVVAHGNVYHPHTLPGFVARIAGDNAGSPSSEETDDVVVGLLTYWVADNQLEIVTIDSLHAGRGIGTALIEAAKHEAQNQDCRRLWLTTTNDNTNALRFYQKRGFSLVAVHRNAVERSRALKPEIPLVGQDGIPLRDEIELEYLLPSA